MEAIDMLKIAADALNEKKAKDIVGIKISDLTVLGEYFLISSANSSTQLRALCDEVEDKLEEAGIRPHHIEGKATGWIALDYGSLIVHVFTRNEREFYGLERMWSDGELLNMEKILEKPQGE